MKSNMNITVSQRAFRFSLHKKKLKFSKQRGNMSEVDLSPEKKTLLNIFESIDQVLAIHKSQSNRCSYVFFFTFLRKKRKIRKRFFLFLREKRTEIRKLFFLFIRKKRTEIRKRFYLFIRKKRNT